LQGEETAGTTCARCDCGTATGAGERGPGGPFRARRHVVWRSPGFPLVPLGYDRSAPPAGREPRGGGGPADLPPPRPLQGATPHFSAQPRVPFGYPGLRPLGPPAGRNFRCRRTAVLRPRSPFRRDEFRGVTQGSLGHSGLRPLGPCGREPRGGGDQPTYGPGGPFSGDVFRGVTQGWRRRTSRSAAPAAITGRHATFFGATQNSLWSPWATTARPPCGARATWRRRTSRSRAPSALTGRDEAAAA
jgi:hypothetical protein